MPPVPVNLAHKLSLFNDLWSPRIVAEMNDCQFKLARLKGDFVWHRHDDTDEAFLVLQGELVIEFRDGPITLRRGELLVVPRGMEHITRAPGECAVLIIERRGVVNTGDAGGPLTAPPDRWI